MLLTGLPVSCLELAARRVAAAEGAAEGPEAVLFGGLQRRDPSPLLAEEVRGWVAKICRLQERQLPLDPQHPDSR